MRKKMISSIQIFIIIIILLPLNSFAATESPQSGYINYAISGVVLNDNILKSIQLVSTSSMPQTADIIAALYNTATKQVEDIDFVKNVVLTRNGAAQTINFNNRINYTNGKVIKFFTWNSINGMQVLTGRYDYTGMATTNLLNNPGFEAISNGSGNGWTNYSVIGWGAWLASGTPIITVDSLVHQEGNYSIQMTASSTGRADVSCDTNIVAGQWYKMSGWIKTSNIVSGSGGARVRLTYYDPNGQ